MYAAIKMVIARKPEPPKNYIKEANNTLRDIIAIGTSLAVLGGAAITAHDYYQKHYSPGTAGNNYWKLVPIKNADYQIATKTKSPELSVLPQNEIFEFTPFDSMIEASNSAIYEYEFTSDSMKIDPIYSGVENRPAPPMPPYMRYTSEPVVPISAAIQFHMGNENSNFSMQQRLDIDRNRPLTNLVGTKRPGPPLVSGRVSKQHP
jgi:hypothetical protein